MRTGVKRTLLVMGAMLGCVGCRHKELWRGGGNIRGVDVAIHWQGEVAGREPTKGMRVHLFPLDGGRPYGKADMPAGGGRVMLECGSSHLTVACHYHARGIYFRNDTEQDEFEAYFAPVTRRTYSRAFPGERTVATAGDDFYVGVNGHYTVAREDEPPNGNIDIYPASVLVTYDFIVKGVKNARHITETRGAVTGMTGTYRLARQAAGQAATTLLFGAAADGTEDRITGSFRTFGRSEGTKNFTIEAIYPAEDGKTGYTLKTWDVTDQVDTPGNRLIIIQDAEMEIPHAETGTGGGFEIDVRDWPDEPVRVPLTF